MVGLKFLGGIDQRVRQARPRQSDIPFGGLSVFVMGDFSQLPPVMNLVVVVALKKQAQRNFT